MSDCNVNEIMAAAGCYACLTPEQLEVIQTELLCRIYTNGGGGGGTPGGSDTQVQFNDGGAFGGDAGLVYNKTTNLLTAGDIAISSLTAGSVLFAGAAGAVTQDNASLFFDNTNNRLGIGTASPQAVVHATSTSATPLILSRTVTSAGEWNFLITNDPVGSGSIFSPGSLTVVCNTANSDFSVRAGNSGTPQFVVESAGSVLAGHTSAFDAGVFEVTSNVSNSGFSSTMFNATGNQGSLVAFNRSKSGTKGTQGLVADNDVLAYMYFRGSDGASFQNAALIKVEVDGTTGVGDIPGRFIFSTTPDGSVNPVERLRIDNAGNVRIGSAGTISSHLLINNAAAGDIGQIIKLAAVPTGDALRVTSSADAVLMRVTSAGSLHVFNTYTDESNYERINMGWSSNVFEFATTGIGTGTSRSISFRAGIAPSTGGQFSVELDGTINFNRANVAVRWSINPNGHLVGGADNTYDIGAAGATRPRSIYVGTDAFVSGKITVGGTATINQVTKILQGSDTHDFASVAAGTESAIRTVTITGAAAGDPVFIGLPDAASTPNIGWSVWVSAANTVSYKFYNRNAVSAVDLGNLTYKFFVHQL